MRALWFSAALAIATTLATAGPATAEPDPAEAVIGALTLAYDAVEWRVEASGETAAIDCVADTCDGVALDVTVTSDASGYCDTEEARTRAESLFRFADRHPTNIYAFGELALVMAQSRNGSAFDVPTAVFACITRDGQIYRFQSRLGDAPLSHFTGSIVLQLLGGLSAPPASIVEIPVSDITVAYRTDVWDSFDTAPAEGFTVLHCLPPTCRDVGPEVLIGAAEGETDCTTGTDLEPYWPHEDDWPREITTGTPESALTFRVHAFWTGCRNARPPHLLACAVHDGVTYRIEAPVFGCQGGPDGVPLAAFMELVEGAWLVP